MIPLSQEHKVITDWSKATVEEVLRGYEEMAADEERGQEAFLWIESSVGECL